MKYRSKPTEIEAIQWTGDNAGEIEAAIGADKASTTVFGDGRLYLLSGQDGQQDWLPVPVGHWIAHWPDDLSDIWPIDPDRFQSRYEPLA